MKMQFNPEVELLYEVLHRLRVAAALLPEQNAAEGEFFTSLEGPHLQDNPPMDCLVITVVWLPKELPELHAKSASLAIYQTYDLKIPIALELDKAGHHYEDKVNLHAPDEEILRAAADIFVRTIYEFFRTGATPSSLSDVLSTLH